MIRLGLTGGIGSGKSTVSRLLEILGIPVYLSDIESKKLTQSSPIIKNKLIDLLGHQLYEDGSLNKAMLSNIIFNDKEKLQQVNSIIHPEVDKHYNEWCNKQKVSHPLVALESAILYESGMVRFTDKVLVVYTPLEERINRTIKRDNTSRDKVIARINNQQSDEDKLKRADFVIYNNEEISLIDQVFDLLTNLDNNGSIIQKYI